MTKLLLTLLAGVCLLPNRGNAQFDEVGFFYGISHYSGDLTERLVEPLEFNNAFGFYVRQRYSEHFGLKFQFVKGTLSGDDANATVESSLWKRNLNFQSDIFELAVLAEYNFFKLEKGAYGLSPYAYAGLAGFYFTPYTKMDGKTYDLSHYRTEGIEYSKYQFSIPFGLGVKMQINDLGTLGIQAGLRKTFTDYLDDVSGYYPEGLTFHGDGNNADIRTNLSYRIPEVNANAPELPMPGSQRGNPEKNDWYMFFGVSVGISL